MGVWESEIRFRYARSTALVCRARRNSCFPFTLSAAVASLESLTPRETTSRILKKGRERVFLPFVHLHLFIPTFSFFPLATPTRPDVGLAFVFLSPLVLLVEKRRYFARQLLLDRSDCSEPSDPALFLLIKF